MNQRIYASSVKELVRNLESVYTNQSGTSGAYSKEGLISRIDDVIFKQREDWMGQQQQTLTPLEELELVDELSLYLQEQKHEYVRYRIFEAMFSMARENALEYRREILCKLVSLAIVSKTAATLECAALWMKSSERKHVIHLVLSLILDYCVLQKDGSKDLKSCLECSPRFCCVFMIALTSHYTMTLSSDKSVEESEIVTSSWPCHALLDIVQHWILKEPSVCFCTATQMDKLWRTVIKATQSLPENLSLTPIDGLAVWCVKSPFAPMSVMSADNSQVSHNGESLSYTQLHSMLHYGFLKAILASKPALKAIAKGSVLGNPDLQLWSKQHAHVLIGDLMTLCNHSDTTPLVGSADELAVDRFSQISQIAISMRVLNCTKDQFQSLSDPLPRTRLLEIVAYGPHSRRYSLDEMPMETGY